MISNDEYEKLFDKSHNEDEEILGKTDFEKYCNEMNVSNSKM